MPEGESPAIIVETIRGSDHRILCVDGEFVAVKREAASLQVMVNPLSWR